MTNEPYLTDNCGGNKVDRLTDKSAAIKLLKQYAPFMRPTKLGKLDEIDVKFQINYLDDTTLTEARNKSRELAAAFLWFGVAGIGSSTSKTEITYEYQGVDIKELANAGVSFPGSSKYIDRTAG